MCENKMPSSNVILIASERMNSAATIRVTHYQLVAVAFNETIMAEIGRVIKTHVGRPGAFQLTNEGRGSTK